LKARLLSAPSAAANSPSTPRVETVQIDSTTGQGTNIGLANANEMLDTYNIVRSVAPTLFEPIATPSGVAPQGQAAPQSENNVPAAEDAATAQTADSKTESDATATSDSADTTTASAPDANAEPNATTDADIKMQPPAEVTDNNTLSLTDSLGNTLSLPTGDGLLSPEVGALLGVNSGSANGTGNQLLPPPPLGMIPPPPPPIGGAPDGPIFVNTNHAPVNKMPSFTAFEQPGLAGFNNSFNIGRFFSDPDGNALSYKITNINDPNSDLTGASMVGSTLNFNVSGNLANDTIVSFSVAAYDGNLYSGATHFTFSLYSLAPPAGFTPTTGHDGSVATPIIFSESGKRFSLLDGSDGINASDGTGNIIFGGNGSDTIILSSSIGFNKGFGDAGNDTLKILGSGSNNLISGGSGNDVLIIESNGTNHKLYGSDGDDVFRFNSIALTPLNNNDTLVDGGAGFDTLQLDGTGTLDLTDINQSQIHDLNAIRVNLGGGSVICVDIKDILEHTDANQLYISADAGGGSSTVNVSNDHSLAALVYKGDVEAHDNIFHAYSNGQQTLYIDTDIATVSGL
jgi:hypothetical protein